MQKTHLWQVEYEEVWDGDFVNSDTKLVLSGPDMGPVIEGVKEAVLLEPPFEDEETGTVQKIVGVNILAVRLDSVVDLVI